MYLNSLNFQLFSIIVIIIFSHDPLPHILVHRYLTITIRCLITRIHKPGGFVYSHGLKFCNKFDAAEIAIRVCAKKITDRKNQNGNITQN